MRVQFTDTQAGKVGKIPTLLHEEEIGFTSEIEEVLNAYGIDPTEAKEEYFKLRGKVGPARAWRFYQGFCLGVNRHRIYTALVRCLLEKEHKSVLRLEEDGLRLKRRIYHIRMKGLKEFMHYIHCWRYHGVTMEGIDKKLEGYGLKDEIPFVEFKHVVGSMWRNEPERERIIFQDAEGYPVSIYNTQVLRTSGIRNAVRASIELSAYETICCHIVTAMQEVPSSVVLLGASEEDFFILDVTGRNEEDIKRVFATLVFPRRYFSRFIRFDGEIEVIDEGIKRLYD